MFSGPPNLVWLRSFEAAARHLNFTVAADELGLTQTAVSLHIKHLEAKLGYDLFVRIPRNLRLTDVGRAYLLPVSRALNDLTYSTNVLFGPEQSNIISIRAPITTMLWLGPQLQLFRNAHPYVDFRLVSTIWADATDEEDVDVDLKFGDGNWLGMHLERLSNETITPICGTEAARNIHRPADFFDVPLIHILGSEGNWSKYFSANGLDPTLGHYGFVVDTTIAAIELVASGSGCAIVVSRIADSVIAGGRSIVKAGNTVQFEQSHFLVRSTSTKSTRPEVESFKTWLRARFSS